MTAIVLPSAPGPVAMTWEMLDFGSELSAVLGGATQRLNRLGGRHAVTVVLPPMLPKLAAEWAVKLSQAKRFGARWNVRQTGITVGAPGAPLINGAGQAGDTVNADGFSASYSFGHGHFFSIVTGAKRYLYRTAAPAVASVAGVLSFALEPPLRVSPADNSVLEFATPFIEGLIDQGNFSWSVDAARLGQMGFTIREVE